VPPVTDKQPTFRIAVLSPDRLAAAGLIDPQHAQLRRLEVLSKPEPLTPEELQHVCSHARVGWEITHHSSGRRPVAEMIHQHYERLDGSGYTQGLRGEQILREARIVAVADVYDDRATSTDRWRSRDSPPLRSTRSAMSVAAHRCWVPQCSTASNRASRDSVEGRERADSLSTHRRGPLMMCVVR
jgi:HD domain